MGWPDAVALIGGSFAFAALLFGLFGMAMDQISIEIRIHIDTRSAPAEPYEGKEHHNGSSSV